MKKSLLASLMILSTVTCLAQSQQPSQFFATPLLLNPALTGKFDGNYRITSTLPSVGEAFISSSLALELPISITSSSSKDSWGIGVRAMTGRSTNGVLASSNAAIATAYHKGLDENGNHQIGIGFQATYHRNTVNSDVTLNPEQLNALPELPLSIPTELLRTDEMLKMNYPAYMDMSAGFLYNGSTDGINNFYLGASGYHLNRPCESYFGKNFFGLEPRYTIHAGGSFPQNEGSRMLYFSTMVSKQAEMKTVTAGGAIGRILHNDVEATHMLFIGAWARYNTYYNSLMPYFGIEHNGFQLGVSYEMAFSRSETPVPVRRGGVEVTFVYLRRSKGYQPSPSPRF